MTTAMPPPPTPPPPPPGPDRDEPIRDVSDTALWVAVYRAQGSRLGRELDIDQVLLIDHAGGVWKRIIAIPSDPPAFEAFWVAG